MATYYASSAEDPNSSTGNAGTIGDPMGLQEAIDAVSAGDTVIVMDDGTYSLSSSITITTNGTKASPISITGANSSGVIDGSSAEIVAGSFIAITGSSTGHYEFQYLQVEADTNTCIQGFDNCLFKDISSSDADSKSTFNLLEYCVLIRCSKTAGPINGYLLGTGSNITVINCYVSSCGGLGTIGGNRSGLVIDGCIVKDCLRDGIQLVIYTQAGVSITNCLFIGGSEHGITISSSGDSNLIVDNCIFYDNSLSGLHASSTPNKPSITVRNCLSVGNGNYGYEWPADILMSVLDSYSQGNTSGHTNGETSVLGSVGTLTSDPFTDAANDDFSINDSAGAGSVLRAVQATQLAGIDKAWPFRSLVSSLVAGGGGGGTRAYFS